MNERITAESCRPPLTKAEYDALATAVASLDVEWEDEHPRRRPTLDRAWQKVQAWQFGIGDEAAKEKH